MLLQMALAVDTSGATQLRLEEGLQREIKERQRKKKSGWKRPAKKRE